MKLLAGGHRRRRARRRHCFGLRRWNLFRPRVDVRGHHGAECLLELRRARLHSRRDHLFLGDLLRQRQILLVVGADAVLHHALRGVVKNQQHFIRARIAQGIVNMRWLGDPRRFQSGFQLLRLPFELLERVRFFFRKRERPQQIGLFLRARLFHQH